MDWHTTLTRSVWRRRFRPWLMAVVALLTRSLGAQADGLEHTWGRTGGGPVTTSHGGGYELQAVAGQATAGSLGDGSDALTLASGYGAIYAVHAFTLRLRLGWNLISIPLQPLDPASQRVLPDTACGPLWRWEEGGYEPASRVLPMHGYWVFSRGAAEHVLQGIAVTDPYRDQSAGWHLVGPAGMPPYPVLAVPLACEPVEAMIGFPWEWGPDLACPATEGLSPGRGFWIGLSGPARVRLGR